MPPAKQDPNMIGPDIYPQMLSRADAARAMMTLRSPATLTRAQAAVQFEWQSSKAPMMPPLSMPGNAS